MRGFIRILNMLMNINMFPKALVDFEMLVMMDTLK